MTKRRYFLLPFCLQEFIYWRALGVLTTYLLIAVGAGGKGEAWGGKGGKLACSRKVSALIYSASNSSSTLPQGHFLSRNFRTATIVMITVVTKNKLPSPHKT